MMEQAAIVIQTKQQRADDRLSLRISKAADHAVGAAIILDLLHSAAVAGEVGHVAPLGDDAVKRRADALEPAPCGRELSCRSRQFNALVVLQIFGGKGLQRL